MRKNVEIGDVFSGATNLTVVDAAPSRNGHRYALVQCDTCERRTEARSTLLKSGKYTCPCAVVRSSKGTDEVVTLQDVMAELRALRKLIEAGPGPGKPAGLQSRSLKVERKAFTLDSSMAGTGTKAEKQARNIEALKMVEGFPDRSLWDLDLIRDRLLIVRQQLDEQHEDELAALFARWTRLFLN